VGMTYTDLNPFMTCCLGRSNAYKLQREDGRYSHQEGMLDYDLIYQHLTGQVTIATYVISELNTCSFAVFDHDSEEPSRGLSVLLDIQERLAYDGIASYLERSRRGGHLWVFCEPTSPALLRSWLLPYRPDDSIEFYPKQDTLSAAVPYGSAIRVPLGIHRLTGERYRFVTCTNGSLVDLFTSYSSALAFFAHVARDRNIPPQPNFLPVQAEVPQPPKLNTLQKNQTLYAPTPSLTLSNIAEWCLSYDPYAVIGRYVQLDPYGHGCCPFGAHHSDGIDSHPSFFVYVPTPPNIMCWYCHTWKRGGSLFDFLKLYYGMSVHDLWVALQQGAQF
jgi:hypothetical protein